MVGVVNFDIHITINNTVIAENSGIVAGNVAIGIMFGTEHVTVRFDRCYIQSGNVTETWSSLTSFPTGLTCWITPVNEYFNRNTMPLHISNTKFISNYGGAAALTFQGRSCYTCNSSSYQILIDSCEVSNNLAHSGYTGLVAGVMSDKSDPWASVLKVRLVIQNSSFHHNIKLQEHSQPDVKLVHFTQLPEVVIINSTFYSNTGTQTIILSRSKVIFQGQVVFQNNTSSTDGGALYLGESSLLQFKPDTRVAFINNTASQRGGAIYVDNMKRGGNIGCFFELDNVLRDSQANTQVVFEGNRAEIAGDALWWTGLLM